MKKKLLLAIMLLMSLTSFAQTEPQVVNVIPADGATDVKVSNIIFSVRYDKNIVVVDTNAIKVNGKSIDRIRVSGEGKILDILSFNEEDKTWCEILRYSKTYTVTIPAGVIENVTTPYSWSFTTEVEPVVASVYPADKAENVPVNVAMTISTDKRINGIYVVENDDPENHGLTISANGSYLKNVSVGHNFSVLTRPVNHPLLPYNTVCTVNLPAECFCGMTTGYTWSFTTESTPVIVATVPANGATEVPLTTNIQVIFDKPVLEGSAKLKNITVKDKAGNDAKSSVSLSSRYLFIYHQDLNPNTVYTVTIPANSIHGITEDFSFSFSTKSVPITIRLADETVVYTGLPLYIQQGVIEGLTGDADLTIEYQYQKEGEETVQTDYALDAGNYTVTASVSDTKYKVTSDTVIFTVEKATPFYELLPVEKVYNGLPVPVVLPPVGGSATADKLPLTAVYEGVGATVYELTGEPPVKVGSYRAIVSTAGDKNHHSASRETTIKILKVAPEIILPDTTKQYDGEPFPAHGTVNPDHLTLTYTYKGVFSDGTVYEPTDMPPTEVGNYTVTATSTEDSTYLSASVTAKMTITHLPASLSLSNKGAPYTGNPIPIDAAVTSPAGLPVVYSYQGINETVYPQTANAPVQTGEYFVTASFAGNNRYAPASASAYLTVSAAGSPFMYLPDRWVAYNGKPQPMSGVSFVPVEASYLIEKTTYIYWSDTYPLTATPPTEVGSYMVTATSPEDINFKSASVTARYYIGKADQTITFPDIPVKQVGSPPFYMNATVSSGLPLTYTSADPSIAEVSEAGYVSIRAEGSVAITAYQAGDKNYNPASASYTLKILSADVLLISLSVNGQDIPVDKTMYYNSGCDTTSRFLVELVTPDGARIDKGHRFTEVINKPDVRAITFTVTSSNGRYWQTYTLTIERRFLFNDLVRTRWNNTMTIRNNPETNGGFLFESFLWYRKPAGSLYFQPISLGQSYSAGNNGETLHPDDIYLVEVVTGTGVRLRSCESAPDLRSMNVSAFPNPAGYNSSINFDVDIDDELLENAAIEIYNMQGMLIGTVPVSGKVTICPTPASAGIYLYIFKSRSGFTKELKVFVQ